MCESDIARKSTTGAAFRPQSSAVNTVILLVLTFDRQSRVAFILDFDCTVGKSRTLKIQKPVRVIAPAQRDRERGFSNSLLSI